MFHFNTFVCDFFFSDIPDKLDAKDKQLNI